MLWKIRTADDTSNELYDSLVRKYERRKNRIKTEQVSFNPASKTAHGR